MTRRTPVFLSALLLLSTTVVAAEPAVPLRIGATPVAESIGGSLRPVVGEGELIGLFQSALSASGRQDLQATFTSARIEEVGGVPYAVARGTNADARCFTSWIRLEPGTGAEVEAAIQFIRIVTCMGTTCPQSGCVAQRDEHGDISFCYCIPAGDCEKVVIIVPIPIPQ